VAGAAGNEIAVATLVAGAALAADVAGGKNCSDTHSGTSHQTSGAPAAKVTGTGTLRNKIVDNFSPTRRIGPAPALPTNRTLRISADTSSRPPEAFEIFDVNFHH
jgi:hypothetical protein